MNPGYLAHLNHELEQLKEAGLYKTERVITSPQQPRLTANGRTELGCNEKLFFQVVKQAFNQRRKMLRNSIRSFSPRIEELDAVLLTRRPEQLSVAEFIDLTNSIEELLKTQVI